MKKSEFIDRVIRSRDDLENTLRQLEKNDDLDQKWSETWKIRHIFSHIIWYEQEMIHLMKSFDMTRNPDIWNNPCEKRNNLVFELIKDISAEEMINSFIETGTQLIDALSSLTQEQFENPMHYYSMPKEWKPELVFQGNTYKHYEEHNEKIKMKFHFPS